ncbi:LysR family transcriptional regulator [Brevibacterium oceani]|uniref:LysR family transcriptional regulator n=1 Tax=Brevibacterium oceani TaxID=358099 RepID=UPI0015E67578|nr:LysR substrate-binding domain-containing protein [Brevibacterium oceani]
MELRQLRYFIAVADELHFGRAAEKLHMSQPPLSLHVGKLERELGVKLFDRSTRSVSLTPAGSRFLDNASRLLGDLDHAVEELRDFSDGRAGRLTVGFVSSAGYTFLPEVVTMFRQSRPRVTLDLVPLASGEQLDRLSAGQLDVGIVRDDISTLASEARAPDGRGRLSSVPVYDERLVACLPKGHRLAQQAEVTARQISRVPMIAYSRDLMPGFVDRVSMALGEHSTEVTVVEQVIHQETALGFVAAGVGTSILPESIRHLLPPSIVAVPLAASPVTRLFAVTGPTTQPPALVEGFVDCLLEASNIGLRSAAIA